MGGRPRCRNVMTAYVQSDLNHNARHHDAGPDLLKAEFSTETDNERQGEARLRRETGDASEIIASIGI
jgi:hypothetical protein